MADGNIRTACVIGAQWHAGIAPSLARALAAHGVATRCLELPQTPPGYTRLPKVLRRRLAAPAEQLIARQNLRRLRAALAGARFDLILLTMCHWLDEETVLWLRRQARQIVYWSMDDPFITWANPPRVRNTLLRVYQHLDWLLVYDAYFCASLQAHCRCRIAHLPLAYDDVVYRPGPEPACRDLAFIGDAFPNRVAALAALDGFELETWGGQFAPGPCRRVHPPVVPAAAAAIYRTSRINLNIHHPQSICGNNARVYEVTGSGGFLLTDYKAEIEQQYLPGQELETFRCLDELREKARYYLLHPEAAGAIARRGLARAQREHTYRHRMATLLALVDSPLAE